LVAGRHDRELFGQVEDDHKFPVRLFPLMT
jgi:hypothetical protein